MPTRRPPVHAVGAVQLLLSCEHARCHIPATYQAYFTAPAKLLRSHRGYDIGALQAARRIAQLCEAPLLTFPVSRLLIEPNRSVGHPQLFSRVGATLSAAQQQQLLRRYYQPHRQRLMWAISHFTGTTLHLGIHSFTPQLHGERRHADVGLLYDPRRAAEKSIAKHLQASLQASLQATLPRLQIRRNYPYRGQADGLTTSLRRHFPPTQYRGLEIELNQKHAKTAFWTILATACAQAIVNLPELKEKTSPASASILKWL